MTWSQTEKIFLDTPPFATESWWARYATSLTGLSRAARDALRVDSQYILEEGILGAGRPSADTWARERVRTGLVMGSVQSGKTASMLGVAALSLDQGVDVVVVLAGTRLSLWRQTYERLVGQLDVGEDGAAKETRRLLCPAPGVALSGSSNSLRDTYRINSAQVRRKFANGRPLIIVAMKQTDHLYALGSSLRNSLFPAIRRLERPLHMLVLDDEADDGSVLDSAMEAERSPFWAGYKQIPRAIADMWDPRSERAPINLFTTYVGYTATPQANFLQEDHNPLAPRDFVVSLRTPLDSGHPVDPASSDAPRSATYPEPTGVDNYYIGGEVFYRRGAQAGLCEELTERAEEDLAASLRAFLVAGAIRLSWAEDAMGPASLLGAQFSSEVEAKGASPAPHSMLVHPAADIEAHFKSAEDILLWAGVEDRETARQNLESGNARLPATLISKMQEELPLWESWIERYRDSSSVLAGEFNMLNPREIPDWTTIRSLLESEVIPGTRISVVNSDPSADDRPEYLPTFDEQSATWRPARDLSTIFVSGNVMSRGLTLEGMTTSLFQRGSNVPFADTQMQMQRWFGYRGKHLELCRLFATGAQIRLFASYHDIDEAIRVAVTAAMEERAPSPVMLHGSRFLATGKIANLSRTPLCAGSKPFVTLINGGMEPDPNAKVLAELFSSDRSSDVTVDHRLRGRALDNALSLTETAEVLDSLEYERYRPGADNHLGLLWSQVQARVSATRSLPSGALLYRAADPREGVGASPVRPDCPYSIAAYLRLWDACLDRPVRGLFVTGTPADLWSMANLQEKRLRQPRFTVGIRFGSGGKVKTSPLASLPFEILATAKRVGERGDLETRWGANDPEAGPLGYRGDEFFDYYHRGEHLPRLTGGSPWRPEGSDGQILFYVNQLPGQLHPTIGVGICIPAGGPEQFAATRTAVLRADWAERAVR